MYSMVYFSSALHRIVLDRIVLKIDRTVSHRIVGGRRIVSHLIAGNSMNRECIKSLVVYRDLYRIALMVKIPIPNKCSISCCHNVPDLLGLTY